MNKSELPPEAMQALMSEALQAAQARLSDTTRLVIRNVPYSIYDLKRMTASGEIDDWPGDVRESIRLFLVSMDKPPEDRYYISYSTPDDPDWPIHVDGPAALKCYIGFALDEVWE